jgi:hypothetical protein
LNRLFPEYSLEAPGNVSWRFFAAKSDMQVKLRPSQDLQGYDIISNQ